MLTNTIVEICSTRLTTAPRRLLHSNHSIQSTSKQSERLTEGVVDHTVRMEFSVAVPANTQAYALVISDRILKFKSDGTKMSVLF